MHKSVPSLPLHSPNTSNNNFLFIHADKKHLRADVYVSDTVRGTQSWGAKMFNLARKHVKAQTENRGKPLRWSQPDISRKHAKEESGKEVLGSGVFALGWGADHSGLLWELWTEWSGDAQQDFDVTWFTVFCRVQCARFCPNLRGKKKNVHYTCVVLILYLNKCFQFFCLCWWVKSATLEI